MFCAGFGCCWFPGFEVVECLFEQAGLLDGYCTLDYMLGFDYDSDACIAVIVFNIMLFWACECVCCFARKLGVVVAIW